MFPIRSPATLCFGIPRVGKPNPFVNALYRRIRNNLLRRLRIITALSLKSQLAKANLNLRSLFAPLRRVFADFPDLDYVGWIYVLALPDNVEVREFSRRPAAITLKCRRAARLHLHQLHLRARDMAVARDERHRSGCRGARGDGDQLLSSVEQPGRDV